MKALFRIAETASVQFPFADNLWPKDWQTTSNHPMRSPSHRSKSPLSSLEDDLELSAPDALKGWRD